MRPILISLVLGISLLASACGSGSTESSDSSSTTDTATTETTSTIEAEALTNADWASVMSDPEKYKGEPVEIVGRVFSVEREGDVLALQIWVDAENSEQNTIVGYKSATFQVADDDYVRVTGEVEGKYTGKNAFGAELTVPTVVADSIVKVDATATAPEAVKTLPRNSAAKDGIVLTVQKVEFADSETRVFVRVKNRTKADLSIYGTSAKAVSGTKALSPEFSTRGYPDLQSDLPSGSESTGVVVFPAMDPAAPLRLIFEGYSEDSSIGKYGAVKYELSWDAAGQPVR